MDPSADSDHEWITIAVLSKARGNRGELLAIPLSNRWESDAVPGKVFLFDLQGRLKSGEPFQVEDIWQHRGALVLKFWGVDSISDAERLAGAEVRIPARERMEPPEGEFYLSDLTGCEVIERSSGAVLGRVQEFEESGGSGLLKVVTEDSKQEILIPFARSICVEIDVKARRIVVELPEGLKDLNT